MAKNYIAGGPIERVVMALENKPDEAHRLVYLMVADCLKMLDDYYRERLDQCQGRNSELSDELIQMRGRITRMDDQISS